MTKIRYESSSLGPVVLGVTGRKVTSKMRKFLEYVIYPRYLPKKYLGHYRFEINCSRGVMVIFSGVFFGINMLY